MGMFFKAKCPRCYDPYPCSCDQPSLHVIVKCECEHCKAKRKGGKSVEPCKGEAGRDD